MLNWNCNFLNSFMVLTCFLYISILFWGQILAE
uniref:Uncharacterized protein n=1 Tax=Rhizophora mucronata TaxID=61149 RepID=A0A2P2MW53_RHIMU